MEKIKRKNIYSNMRRLSKMENNNFEYMSVSAEELKSMKFTDLILEYSRDGWELLKFNGKNGILRRSV
jgi:hypothetical protein